MIWLSVLCIILLAIVIALSIKMILLRKSIVEIREGFAEKLKSDTNTLITVSTQDKTINHLASAINAQLRELRKQRHRFLRGDMELKCAVTNISHDLRTPLTAISGYLDLLDSAEKNADVERYIEIIKNRTEVLKQLTEELFRYSVITSPEYDYSIEDVEINTVLEESILDFYVPLQERNITPNSQQFILGSINQSS